MVPRLLLWFGFWILALGAEARREEERGEDLEGQEVVK
jgi:hypothetical protein